VEKMHISKISALMLCLALTTGAQAQTGWKAGAAKVEITPSGPIWMAGYSSRTKASEGIRKPIYVVALALQDETQKTSVLVTFDLVAIGHDWGIAVADRCQKEFGLTRDHLWLNSSHSHSGPVTPYGNAGFGNNRMTPAETEFARKYTLEMMDKTVRAVGQAIHNMSPATVEYGLGLAGVAVNRRRVTHREYPGPVDHDVSVLAVRGANGELRAVVVGYACHGTSLGDYQISGDWPGYMKEEIERTHPGTTALFVQDCGADANPLPRYQGTDPAMLHYGVELAQWHAKTMAAAVDLVLHEKMTPESGPLRTAYELVDLPLRPASKEQLQTWLNSSNRDQQSMGKMLLAKIERDGKLPDRISYPVEVWRFGQGLQCIILGGEVVVDYALRLKGQYGWENTWVAGYSNDVMGYIPSLRVLKEGGYEGGDANRRLGGPFGAAVEEIIVEKVGDLMKRTAE
jgi:hypothetical protein